MFLLKRKLRAFLFLFFVFFLILLLSFGRASYSVRSFFLDLAKLPLLAVNAISQEFRALIFFHRSYRDNIKLRSEFDKVKAEAFNFQGLLLENKRLRELLDLKERTSHATTAAKVMGKDFGPFRPFIILDKGRAAGIELYSPVFSHRGLVGKVLELGRYSSKVILINVPDLSVPAVNVRTREQGLVSGTLNGRCKLRFLDLDSDVAEGDLIVTSGLNMVYPEGIAIGTVKLIGVESSGLGKFAILEPAVDVFCLDEVLIVTS